MYQRKYPYHLTQCKTGQISWIEGTLISFILFLQRTDLKCILGIGAWWELPLHPHLSLLLALSIPVCPSLRVCNTLHDTIVKYILNSGWCIYYIEWMLLSTIVVRHPYCGSEDSIIALSERRYNMRGKMVSAPKELVQRQLWGKLPITSYTAYIEVVKLSYLFCHVARSYNIWIAENHITSVLIMNIPCESNKLLRNQLYMCL